MSQDGGLGSKGKGLGVSRGRGLGSKRQGHVVRNGRGGVMGCLGNSGTPGTGVRGTGVGGQRLGVRSVGRTGCGLCRERGNWVEDLRVLGF